MIISKHITVLVWIAAIIWATLLILQGVSLPSGFFKPAPSVIGGVILILGAFERWLWRWNLLHPWFVSTPDLNGSWKGELRSSWTDPNTGIRKEPTEAYMVVRQTLSTIRARLSTRKSASELLAGSIIHNEEGLHDFIGVYRNIPKMLERQDSPIHYGGLLIRVNGNPPRTLCGEYWTDRNTKGELKFTAKSKENYCDFDSASHGSFKEL
jgi:hypothetical protein